MLRGGNTTFIVADERQLVQAMSESERAPIEALEERLRLDLQILLGHIPAHRQAAMFLHGAWRLMSCHRSMAAKPDEFTVL